MAPLGPGEILAGLIVLLCAIFAKFDFMIALTLSVAALTALFLWAKRGTGYWERRGVPGPKPDLIFGNMFQIGDGFKQFDIDNVKKYGPVYGADFVSYKELNVADFDMLRQILVKDFGDFQNRLVDEMFVCNQEIRRCMISVLKDERWKNVRKTITPAFTTGRIKKMFPIISRCVETTESIIDDCIDNSNGLVDVKKVFGNLSMDIVAQTAFAVNVSTQKDQDSDFIRYASSLVDIAFSNKEMAFMVMFPNVTDFIGKVFKYPVLAPGCDAFFEDVIRQIIKERRSHPRKENPDFLQLLLNCVHENDDLENAGDLMSDTIGNAKKIELSEMELMAQAYAFLAAGYSTTGTLFEFMNYALAANPDVQHKAYEQVMDVLKDKEEIEYDDVMRMPYLQQIIEETLRMYPPAPRYDRACGTDVTINDIHIEKGTSIMIPVFAIHYDERYYPEPEKFDPARFEPSEKAKRDPLTFMPFGFGPRNCLGMRFAEIEVRLTMARILRKFHLELSEELKGKPLELLSGGMLMPKSKIMLIVTKRNE